jgi:hypothetical protein
LALERLAELPAAPAAPAKRKVTQRPWLWIKFWWETYNPTEALVPWKAPDVVVEGKSLNDGRVWTPVLGDGKLEQIRDWMTLQGLTVLGYELIASRRWAGHWQGMYKLTIGQRGGGYGK